MINVKKHTLESIILFLLSPFLTLFFQIYYVIKGSKFALNTSIVTLGLIGYIFVPSLTNDKTRYYERYEVLKNLNLKGFYDYLLITNRPDFFFEFLNFLFASNNINIQILFFILNTFSIYTIFRISDLVTNYFKGNKRLVCFLLILFSFAVQHLYSGIRFTFASCILLWGIYFFQFKKAKLLGVILLLLSITTHFSMLAMALVFIFYVLFKNVNFKYVFYFSFIFLLIPKDILSQIFFMIDFNSGYETKVGAYIADDDFITQNFDTNFSSIIVYYARNIWIYIAYIYLIFESKSKNNAFLQLLFIFIAALNLFYAFPTVFSRYLIIIKFLFTIYLIFKYLNNKRGVVFLFLGLYLISFIVDLYVLRPNLIETFNDDSNISLFTILLRNVGLEHVIDNR